MTDDVLAGELKVAAELSGHADYMTWMHASAVLDAARRTVGIRRELLRVRVMEFAARSRLTPAVVWRNVRTVAWLRDHDLPQVAAAPVIAIGIVASIVANKDADDSSKLTLVRELDEKARSDADFVPSRDAVRERLRVRHRREAEYVRSTDVWHFDSYASDMGRADQPFRLPGQAALNLVHRFWPREGRIVSAMCGSGTVLDACARLGVADYVGCDLRLDSRVAERHRDHFASFDVTASDWTPVCAPGTAGLIVVTPPPHAFGGSAETDSPRDLGRLVDPDEWVGAMEHVVAGATAALMVGGVVAVSVRATAEYEHGAPVPDLRYEVGRLLAEAGFEFSLANPVIAVGRPRARQHDGAWLYPAAVQVIVMRKLHP